MLVISWSESCHPLAITPKEGILMLVWPYVSRGDSASLTRKFQTKEFRRSWILLTTWLRIQANFAYGRLPEVQIYH